MKLLALALVALVAFGCRSTEPRHLIVTCHAPRMAGADSVCEWLDTTTGQGGPGRHP